MVKRLGTENYMIMYFHWLDIYSVSSEISKCSTALVI